jgi:outer membrane biosynthesis protein TonB
MKQQREDLKTPLTISAALHVGGMLFLYFGLPSFFNPPPALPWTPVPIDIVDIGEITNTRIRSEEEQKAARTAPKEKPAPVEPEKKPEPPKPTPPEPKPAVQEEPPKPDEVALPDKKKKPEPPKEKEKPKPKPQPQVDPLASVLKNVAKMKPAPSPVADAKESDQKREGESDAAEISQQGPALADRLSISQEDALRRQISGCWNMPVGARNAEELIVEVLIEVNEDRTVRSAEIVDQVRMNTDSYFRAAAESALRALRNPKCTPLELPPDQYDKWKTIRFNFDPRDML